MSFPFIYLWIRKQGREDYTYWRQLNAKPSNTVIIGCPSFLVCLRHSYLWSAVCCHKVMASICHPWTNQERRLCSLWLPNSSPNRLAKARFAQDSFLVWAKCVGLSRLWCSNRLHDSRLAVMLHKWPFRDNSIVKSSCQNLQWLQSASNFGLELVLLVWHMSLSSVWRAAEIHFHVVVGFVRLSVGVYCKSLELNSCLKLWMLLSHLLLFYICSSYLNAGVPGATKVAGIKPSAPAWCIYIISCCTWVESSSATWYSNNCMTLSATVVILYNCLQTWSIHS